MFDETPANAIPSPVAIVGAGFLGRALAIRLTCAVLVTTRGAPWSGGFRPGLTHAFMDVCVDPIERLRAVLADVRALVVAYAPGRTQGRRELYVEGTRRLLLACTALDIPRVVHIGSTSALPDIEGPVDETCESWPQHERGRVQREAEGEVLAWGRAHGRDVTVLRLGGLYGPTRELGALLRRATMPLCGDGMESTNLIHIDDATSAVIAALQRRDAECSIVHVVADDHRPRREIYPVAAHRLGLPAVTFAEPCPPTSRARGKVVSNERLKTWLGVTLKYPRHALGDEDA